MALTTFAQLWNREIPTWSFRNSSIVISVDAHNNNGNPNDEPLTQRAAILEVPLIGGHEGMGRVVAIGAVSLFIIQVWNMLQRIRVVWVYYYIPMFFYYIWLDASFSLPYELRDYPRLPGLSSSLLRISMSIVGSAIGWTFYAYHKIWAHVSKLIFNQVFRPMRKPILQTHYFFSTLHHSHPDHTYQSFQARVWSPLERYILSDELIV